MTFDLPEKDMPSILTHRLSGELWMSTRIRFARMEIKTNESPLTPNEIKSLNGSPILPRLFFERKRGVVDYLRLRWAIFDGTAWPIISLLTGRTIEYILRDTGKHSIFNQVHRPYHLRFCRHCAGEQRERFMLSWWTRNANLPMVSMCQVHACALELIKTDVVENGQGKLPHEFLASNNPITKANNPALKLSQAMIKFCESYPLNDIESISAKIAASRATSEPLNLCFASIDPAVLHSKVCYWPPERHSGLTDDGSLDEELAHCILGNRLLNESDLWHSDANLLCVIPAKVDPGSLISAVTEISRYRGLRSGRSRLAKYCKLMLVREIFLKKRDLSIARIEHAAIELVLVQVLDPSWLHRFLSTHFVDHEQILPVLKNRLSFALLIIREACRFWSLPGGGSVQLKAFIWKFKINDEIIPAWSSSLLTLCSEQAQPFLRELYRGPGNSYPRREFNFRFDRRPI